MAEIKQNTQGSVYLFTGDGKGKTSAALGTMVRGLGQGWRVAWISWYKEPQWQLSEFEFVQSLQQTAAYHNQIEMNLMGAGFYIQAPSSVINNKHQNIKIAPVGNQGEQKVIDDDSPQKHQQVAQQALQKAEQYLNESTPPQLLILDEICNAIDDGLLTESSVLELLEQRNSTHIIMTGRQASQKLIAAVDLATTMEKIKHPYDQGSLAVAGLDY